MYVQRFGVKSQEEGCPSIDPSDLRGTSAISLGRRCLHLSAFATWWSLNWF